MIKSTVKCIFGESPCFQSVLLLLIRVMIGIIFVQTGWGKLHHLADVTSFFTQIGIPYPHLNAILASVTELLGGIALILGLLTRLAVIPLSVVMIIAILTVQLPEIHSIYDLIRAQELDYLVFFLLLASTGAGKYSLDRLVSISLIEKE